MFFSDPPPKPMYLHKIPEVSIDIRGNAYNRNTRSYLPYNPHTKVVRYAYPKMNKREAFSVEYLVRRYYYSPYDDYEASAIKSLDEQGFPRYLIMCDGKVFNLITWNYMKSSRDFHGYRRYTLQNTYDQSETVLAHRLVATAFLPNPDKLPVVDHKDCDPSNNHVSNLRWVSQKDNVAGAIAYGRHPCVLPVMHEIIFD